MSYPWTSAEVTNLETMHRAGSTDQQIADTGTRTRDAVTSKRIRLDLLIMEPYGEQARWTDWDRKSLIHLHNRHWTWVAIAKELHRTLKNIQWQAHKLGLRKRGG